MFGTPLPIGWVIVFTAAGVMGYWAKWGRERLKVYGLSRILDLVPLREPWKARAEFLLFVGLGCLIGIGVVQPVNVTQSLTAGFTWVGLFTRMQEPGKMKGVEGNG